MILGIIVILLVAGVTYWHYAQGFFSATFSAICTVLAALIAVSYHEAVVMTLLRGKMADYAAAMALVGLFAGTYLILRIIFDKAIPGNVRLPLYVDRIGGALMGVVAGLYAAGIFVLAAEALPFGPSIGGYARYELDDDREVRVMMTGANQMKDIEIPGQLKEDRFDVGSRKPLIIPVDDIVLATVQKLSDGGSLAGNQSLASVHPDYADELFAQRLGIQVGAKRAAVNLDGAKAQVTVPTPGVFEFNQNIEKSQLDAELSQVHQRPASLKKPSPPEDFPLVVRVIFERNAADSTDALVRVSPASVRLVAEGTNYWPVGTVERGQMIYVQKVDDPLIINVKEKDTGADFLFFVDPNKVLEGDPKTTERKVKDGVFVEVKKLARIDLGGQEVRVGVTRSPSVEVMRKPDVLKNKDNKAQTGTADASAAPITIGSVTVNEKLITPINVGTPDANASNVQLKGGTVTLKEKKFAKLHIEPTESIRLLSEGSFAIDDLFVPPGKKMVQVSATPPEEGGNAWAWADNLNKFALVDSNGKIYKPAGAWAKVKERQADRLVAAYDSSGATPSVSRSEGRPTDVVIAFLVPAGTTLKQLNYEGKPVHETNLTVQ